MYVCRKSLYPFSPVTLTLMSWNALVQKFDIDLSFKFYTKIRWRRTANRLTQNGPSKIRVPILSTSTKTVFMCKNLLYQAEQRDEASRRNTADRKIETDFFFKLKETPPKIIRLETDFIFRLPRQNSYAGLCVFDRSGKILSPDTNRECKIVSISHSLLPIPNIRSGDKRSCDVISSISGTFWHARHGQPIAASV